MSLAIFARHKYREKWESTLEYFFVKNLENVQGDERDVIFISTVYGPDADTGVVMNRFGPVNSNVGHRRLNVLFTRAKQRVDLFTSMRSSDIRIPEGASPGIKALKSYLEYSETGRLEQGVVTGRNPIQNLRFLSEIALPNMVLRLFLRLALLGTSSIWP